MVAYYRLTYVNLQLTKNPFKIIATAGSINFSNLNLFIMIEAAPLKYLRNLFTIPTIYIHIYLLLYYCIYDYL